VADRALARGHVLAGLLPAADEVGGQGLEAFAPGGQARFVPCRERGLQGVARGAQAVDQRRRLAFQSRRGRNQCRFVATGQRLGGGLLARERVGPGVGVGGAGGLPPRRPCACAERANSAPSPAASASFACRCASRALRQLSAAWVLAASNPDESCVSCRSTAWATAWRSPSVSRATPARVSATTGCSDA